MFRVVDLEVVSDELVVADLLRGLHLLLVAVLLLPHIALLLRLVGAHQARLLHGILDGAHKDGEDQYTNS